MEWITLTLLVPCLEMIRRYWNINHVIVTNKFCLYHSVNSFYSRAPRPALNTDLYSLGTLTPFVQHSHMFSSPVKHSCNPLRPQTSSWFDRAASNCCCWQQGPTVAPAEPSSLLPSCLFFSPWDRAERGSSARTRTKQQHQAMRRGRRGRWRLQNHPSTHLFSHHPATRTQLAACPKAYLKSSWDSSIIYTV